MENENSVNVEPWGLTLLGLSDKRSSWNVGQKSIVITERTPLDTQDEGTLAMSSLQKSSRLLPFGMPGSVHALSSRLELVGASSPLTIVWCFRCCLLKNSGSLKHFSRLEARCSAVGELGVDLEDSKSDCSKVKVEIRGGSSSRNVRRCFAISHAIDFFQNLWI